MVREVEPEVRSPHRRSWLTRNLALLTVISLTQDAASELLYPLLPILITGVLAAPPVVLGVIEGLADFTAGISRYVAGRWSDRRGRKPFVLAGYSLAALGKVLVALAWAWPVVLFGRVVDRFGKGVRAAPRDAMIAASVPRAALGRAFGFHRAGDSLGAVIGPLLGLAILTASGGNLRWTLWWAVVPAVLSAVLVLAVREPARVSGRAASAEAAVGSVVVDRAPSVRQGSVPGAGFLRRSPLPRRFWRVTAALVAVAAVNVPDAMLLLRVTEVGMSPGAAVLGYVIYNAVYALGSYPAGVLTDRWPRPVVYGVGLLAFAVAYVGLGIVDGGPAVFGLLAVYGLFPAFTDGVGKAWISSLVDDGVRGRAQGTFQALVSGGVLFAGAWAGLMWSVGRGGGSVPLVIAGLGALGGGVVMIGVGLRQRYRAVRR
jgi:MFS family permease